MFSGEEGSSGGAGLGYSRGSGVWKGGGGAEWERGANLKEYYTKREEQEAQAVWVQFE